MRRHREPGFNRKELAMDMLTRRALLRTSALVPVALAAGCAMPGSPAAGLASAIDDIKIIAGGLLGSLPGLSGLLPSNVLSNVTSIINKLGQVASTISGAVSPSAAQSPMKAFEDLLNTVIQKVTPFVAAVPGIGEIFTAASVLLPVAEGAIGMIADVISPKTARRMGPDTARLILNRAAAAR